MANRIRELREAAELSMQDLADRVGTSASQINKLEKGQRRLTTDWMQRVANALNCEPQDLLANGRPVAPVELIGFVGAGQQVFPFDGDPPLRNLPPPPGMTGGIAVEVRGDSMLPVYRPGDRLYAQPVPTLDDRIVNRDCVVDVKDGPRLVKRVRRGTRRNTWRLFSYGTLEESEDLRLTAAAVVSWVRRV